MLTQHRATGNPGQPSPDDHFVVAEGNPGRPAATAPYTQQIGNPGVPSVHPAVHGDGNPGPLTM